MNLRIRPIHRCTETRVRAHPFLCLLAYCVDWPMCQALAPPLFGDEALPMARRQRDPVAPAQPSPAAQRNLVPLAANLRRAEKGYRPEVLAALALSF